MDTVDVVSERISVRTKKIHGDGVARGICINIYLCTFPREHVYFARVF